MLTMGHVSFSLVPRSLGKLNSTANEPRVIRRRLKENAASGSTPKAGAAGKINFAFREATINPPTRPAPVKYKSPVSGESIAHASDADWSPDDAIQNVSFIRRINCCGVSAFNE